MLIMHHASPSEPSSWLVIWTILNRVAEDGMRWVCLLSSLIDTTIPAAPDIDTLESLLFFTHDYDERWIEMKMIMMMQKMLMVMATFHSIIMTMIHDVSTSSCLISHWYRWCFPSSFFSFRFYYFSEYDVMMGGKKRQKISPSPSSASWSMGWYLTVSVHTDSRREKKRLSCFMSTSLNFKDKKEKEREI